MTRLAVFERPGLAPPKEIHFARGPIGAVLEAEYPAGFGGAKPQYWLTPKHGPTQQLESEEALSREFEPDDIVYCLLCPRGPLGVVAGLAIAAIIVGIVVFSKVAPTRRSEADDSEDQGDNAPDLKRQNQLVKPGTRIPALYGQNRIYPSLATPGFVLHMGEKQELTELFVLGEGYHKITQPKLGETPLSDLDHATLTTYGPNERLPKYLRTIQANRNVSRLLLRSPDDALKQQDVWFDASTRRLSFSTKIHKPLHKAGAFQVLGSQNNDGYYESVDRGGSDPYWVEVRQPLQNEASTGVYFEIPEKGVETQHLEAVEGQAIEIYGDTLVAPLEYETTQPDGSVTSQRASIRDGARYVFDGGNRFGMRRIVKCKSVGYSYRYVGGRGVSTKITILTAKFQDLDGSSIYLGSKSIKHDDRKNTLRIKKVKFDESLTVTSVGSKQNWTDWYTVGTDDKPITEIWFTYGFPSGLWEQEAGDPRDTLTINILVEYQRLQGGQAVGPLETDNIETRDETRQEIRFTERYTGLDEGQWRIRWRRLQNTRHDKADKYYQDETRIYEVAGARKIKRGQFNDLTTFVLKLQGGDEIGSITDRRLNVVQERELQKVNSNGELSARRKPTRRMVDALVDTALRDGRQSAGNLGLQQLGELQARLDALDGGGQGTFSHAFTRTMSVDDQMQAIADAARCVVYRIGAKLYIARREEKAEPGSALFCRRNMLWESYQRTIAFSSSNDAQAVTLKWVDRDNDFREREYTYPEKLRGKRAKRITVVGIDNWAQAYRRARFEHARISYNADKLAITVTEEGQLVEPFAMVRVEDVLLHIFRSGEVLDYDEGLRQLTLDREVQFAEVLEPYSVVLRRPDGLSCEEYFVTAVDGEPTKVQLYEENSVRIVGKSHQVRTLFSFGPMRGHTAERWTVEEATPMRGKVRLVLSSYDVRAYSGDSVALPPAPSI